MNAPVAISILAHKPALKARPVNEGQRRLLWWLLGSDNAAIRHLREVELRQMEITDRQRDRLIDGELIPTNGIAARIARVTDGAVRLDDWSAAPEGAWGDRPLPRPALRLVA